MIKGARKQLIVLQTANSRYFDGAYFILRHDIEASKNCDEDILREANRILADNALSSRGSIKRHLHRAIPFGAGSLCGAGAAVLICLLL